MQKKIVKVIGVLAVVLLLSMAVVGAASADTHFHNDVTFTTPIDDTAKLTSLCTAGGSGYLTADITGTFTVASDKTVNLCLNGHVINGNGAGSVFTVNGTLNLYDCNSENQTHYFTVNESPTTRTAGLWVWDDTETTSKCWLTGGCITGGTGTTLGSPVQVVGGGVFNNGSFTMNGGNIVGNTASGTSGYGGGVCNGCTNPDTDGIFIMNGGRIIGNTASIHGGGMYQFNDSSKFYMYGGTISNNVAPGSASQGVGGGVYFKYGSMNVGGTAQITENKYSTGSALGDDNLFIDTSKTITIDTTTEKHLTDSARISVYRSNESAFTNAGCANYESCFCSERQGYFVDKSSSGELKLSISPFAGACYDVLVDSEITGGTVTVCPTRATFTNDYDNYHSWVFVTVIPDPGYELTSSSLKYYYPYTGKYYDISDGKFEMVYGGSGAPTVYAAFEVSDYDIIYKDEGGNPYSGSNQSSLPATHTYGTETTLVNGTKSGYTFDGWYTTSGCAGEPVTTLGATEYTSDITLYAKWTEASPVYTFTIPATADLRTSVDGIVTYPVNITATTPVEGKSLVLTLESDADATHETTVTHTLFSLKDSGSNYAYYKVGMVSGNDFKPLQGKNGATGKNTVLTLNMSTQSSVDGTLGFKTIELPSFTGTYTGTLNFQITVV